MPVCFKPRTLLIPCSISGIEEVLKATLRMAKRGGNISQANEFEILFKDNTTVNWQESPDPRYGYREELCSFVFIPCLLCT